MSRTIEEKPQQPQADHERRCAKKMKKITSICSLVCAFLVGCAAIVPVERALQDKVPFVISQVLLRDVIAELSKSATTDIRIDPRLNEVADLCITYIPTSKATTHIPLGVALDILRMQTVLQCKVSVHWRVEGNHILFFYSGSDEEYKTLKKRDQPNELVPPPSKRVGRP
jgi:hypothetical protein